MLANPACAGSKIGVSDQRTYIWWLFLCMMAVLNMIVWSWALWIKADMSDFSLAHPILSGIYVLVCAFRSFYPRIDLERYCLFDTPLSSVVLGRTLATIAELCFSIQCSLLIYDLGILLDSSTIVYIAYAIVPIIIIAQTFCWYAALTLNHFWHGMEELAWVVMISLAAFCFMIGLTTLDGAYKALMTIGLFSCVGSAYIMLFIDIPMYFSRKDESQQSGIQYLTVEEGVQDALSRRVQTSDWKVWKKEALWITPYFTVGVWLSIGMMLINLNSVI